MDKRHLRDLIKNKIKESMKNNLKNRYHNSKSLVPSEKKSSLTRSGQGD